MSLFEDGYRASPGGGDSDDRAVPGAGQLRVHTVAEVVQELRDVVEGTFWQVAVKGEVSRPSRPASGHIYMTLKEEGNVLPGVMFRTAAMKLGFELREGMEVIAWGRLTVYGPQGKYQIVIDRLVEGGGVGSLAAAFEATKRKLQAAGLFAEERKRALPFRPRRVALVTSATGAVVHDMLDTMLRRCPRIEVLVVDVRVQGEMAAGEIESAVRRLVPRGQAVRRADIDADVAVVARGGGSLEDLWPFNDERLALAVAECKIPVVSAVGHETDFTICDLVADLRAKTPTEAAYLVVPDIAEELGMVEAARRSLTRAMRRPVDSYRARLEGVGRSGAMAGPRHLIELKRQRVIELHQRSLVWLREGGRWRGRTEELLRRARARLPRTESLRRVAEQLLGHARNQLRGSVARRREAAERSVAHLRAVSPEAVLARGYSITRDAAGRVVTHADQVDVGARIETLLAQGRVTSEVTDRQGTRRERDG